MAKIPKKLTIDVVNTKLVKTLVELLELYKDELPEKLKDSLHELADHKAFELGGSYIKDFKCIADGIEIQDKYFITTFNKILKRITYNKHDNGHIITAGENVAEFYLKPKSVRILSGKTVLMEW